MAYSRLGRGLHQALLQSRQCLRPGSYRSRRGFWVHALRTQWGVLRRGVERLPGRGYIRECLVPTLLLQYLLFSVSGRELKKTVPCLLIDVAAEGIDRLQVDPFPDLELKVFGTQRLQSVWPHRARVLEALAGFLDGSAADPPDRLDAYFTCGSEEELLPLAAPVGAEAIQNDVLQQLLMHATTQAEALASLNTRLQSLEAPVAAAPAASPAPAAAVALEGAGVPQ